MSSQSTPTSLTSAKARSASTSALRSTAALAHAFGEVVGEVGIVGDDRAIARLDRALAGDAEARDAHQRQEAALVADLGVLDDPPGAADREQFRRLGVGVVAGERLDDADQPLARQRVVEHFEIARLEHGELDRPARQQQRAVEREQRQHARHVARAAIVSIKLHDAQFALARRQPVKTGSPTACGAPSRPPDPSGPRPRRTAAIACAPPRRSICGRA